MMLDIEKTSVNEPSNLMTSDKYVKSKNVCKGIYRFFSKKVQLDNYIKFGLLKGNNQKFKTFCHLASQKTGLQSQTI